MLVSQLLVLTNNPQVAEKYVHVETVSGGLLNVLQTARDYIHQGHQLLTHPLFGSVKPNETPYKSIVLSRERGALDYQSLRIIEGSIEVATRMIQECPPPVWSERILRDFQLIDLSLVESALDSLLIM